MQIMNSTARANAFELEQETWCRYAAATDLSTPTLNCNTTINQNNINHGDKVSVTEDLLPGKNSHGRTRFVADTQGDGFHRVFM